MELFREVQGGIVVVHVGKEPMDDCARKQTTGECQWQDKASCAECLRTILQKYAQEATQ